MTTQKTFLFTDLENSTQLWEQAPLVMKDALARHDEIMHAAVRGHNGLIVKTTGDGLHAAFDSAVDGVEAAVSMQRAIGAEDWPAETGQLKIRIGLHTGESQERAGDYYGTAVNTAARIMGLGHGGQILVSEVTVLILRGQGLADISFTDLGAHSLKGVAQPERIYQLNHPELAQEFPPLKSPSSPKHNLPAELTPLVGRDREIESLSGLLGDPGQALVSIVAPGGTGKSHLALELGWRMVDEFGNGVYFVELAPITNSEYIVPTVAEAVGYQFQQNGRSQKQQILDFLTNKEMLLIMDNYEHLIDGGAAIVTDMLRSASGLKILATSRQRLHLLGETLFTLHGLSLPENEAEDAYHYPAVKLFHQFAQRTNPEFELTPGNLPDVVQICWQVHGMPLGLLLAAAWVSVLSTAEIAEEIQQSLDILEAEGNELPDRQRSVRAVFEQAWSMMAEPEQNAFMKMALFRGGFTRQAGQEVAGAGLRQLQSLVNKALLERNTSQGRYDVHELLRQYAAEKLQGSDQDQQVKDTHATHYLAYLAQQSVNLKGAQQLPTLEEIEQDFENIRAAWETAIHNQAYDLIEEALEAMYLFCFLQSRLEDGKTLFEQARKGLAPGAGEEPHPVWLASGIRFYDTSKDQQALKERLEASLENARQRSDRMETAFCLYSLATLAHYVDNDPPTAIAYYQECVDIYRGLGENYYLADTLSHLGEAHQLIGQTEFTLKYVHEAYELQRQIGDYIGESETLRALSMTAWQTGEYDAMVDYQEKAYALQLQTNYIVGQATSNLYLGSFKLFDGRSEEALIQVQLGLDQALEIADFSTQAWCHSILGFIKIARGDYAGAEEDVKRAEAIATDPFRQTGGGNPFLQMQINLGRFQLDAIKGNFETARKHLIQPLNLAVMTASQAYLPISMAFTAFVYVQDGHAEKAVELIGLALKKRNLITNWLRGYSLLTDLQSEIKESLKQEAFEAAWERGESMDLMTTSQQVLEYLESNLTE